MTAWLNVGEARIVQVIERLLGVRVGLSVGYVCYIYIRICYGVARQLQYNRQIP